MEFAEYLLQLRKSKRVSQKSLAQAVGVSYTYISKIENGVFPPPSEDTLIKIADALGENRDKMIMMANKVPKDLKDIVTKDPEMPAFLRSVSYEELKELREIYNNKKEK